MPDFSQEGLTTLLVDNLGYAPADAHGMVQELLAMKSDIQNAFIDWWQHGIVPSKPEYSGHTPASLATEYHLQPVASFLTLDWVATEPEVALKALSEGYDEILPG